MDLLAKWIQKLFPLYDMLRNSRARLFFRLACYLYFLAAILHAELESSFWGITLHYRPGLSYAAFALASIFLLASVIWSILRKESFSGVKDVLSYYVNRRGGLEFAAYYRDSQDLSKVTSHSNQGEIKNTLMSLDISEVSSEELIEIWSGLASQVHLAMSSLDHVLAPTLHGQNLRVVLDTEQGALFYTRIDGKRFVFGATLDQPRINTGRADKEMKAIRDALQNSLSPHAAQP